MAKNKRSRRRARTKSRQKKQQQVEALREIIDERKEEQALRKIEEAASILEESVEEDEPDTTVVNVSVSTDGEDTVHEMEVVTSEEIPDIKMFETFEKTTQPTWFEKLVNFFSGKQTDNVLLVQKDAAGDWRWFGWVSNNFKDREGDIITEAAHEEYVATLNEKPHLMPHFCSWHIPQTKSTHRADWVSYTNGFLLMSGKLEDKEAEGLVRVGSKYQLGMSHGFVAMHSPDNPHIITKYRTLEASVLPVDYAANPWTDIQTLSKEVSMSDLNKQTFLEQQFGTEFVQDVLTSTEDAQKALGDAGVESKETEAGSETPEPVELDTKAVAEAVAEAIGLKELNEFLVDVKKSQDELLERVAQLEKSDDKKIAETVSPPNASASVIWRNRQSQSDKTEISDEEEKELSESVPSQAGKKDYAWVRDAFGNNSGGA